MADIATSRDMMDVSTDRPQTNTYSPSERTTQQPRTSDFANGLGKDLTNGVTHGLTNGTVSPGTSVSSTSSSAHSKMSTHLTACVTGQCAEGCRFLLTLHPDIEGMTLPRYLNKLPEVAAKEVVDEQV